MFSTLARWKFHDHPAAPRFVWGHLSHAHRSATLDKNQRQMIKDPVGQGFGAQGFAQKGTVWPDLEEMSMCILGRKLHAYGFVWK